MQAKSILSRFLKSETVTLSNGQILAVPEGADPSAFKRFEEAKLQRASNPKKKSPKKSRSGSSRHRAMRTSVPLGPSSFERQAQRAGRATAELVERVNRKPDEGESRIAWLTANGRMTVLEVSL